MVKRLKVKPGDILLIQLASNAYAAAIVLHVSKRFRDGIMIGVVHQLFPTPEDIKIDNLSTQLVDIPNYTGRPSLENDWPLIGHNQALLEQIPIPILCAGYTLYFKDEELGNVKPEEIDNYPELSGEGKHYVENKLRRYFAIPVDKSIPESD